MASSTRGAILGDLRAGFDRIVCSCKGSGKIWDLSRLGLNGPNEFIDWVYAVEMFNNRADRDTNCYRSSSVWSYPLCFDISTTSP